MFIFYSAVSLTTELRKVWGLGTERENREREREQKRPERGRHRERRRGPLGWEREREENEWDRKNKQKRKGWEHEKDRNSDQSDWEKEIDKGSVERRREDWEWERKMLRKLLASARNWKSGVKATTSDSLHSSQKLTFSWPDCRKLRHLIFSVKCKIPRWCHFSASIGNTTKVSCD